MSFKKQLRQEVLAHLSALSQTERSEKQVSLYKQLFDSLEWQQAKTIAVTISKQPECETRPVIEQAWKEGKGVFIPRTVTNGRLMEFCSYTHKTDTRDVYGLQEPLLEAISTSKDSIDLILVPGVVYHQNGYRIGFGGGYYDRYLADYRGKTVSLVFEEQLSDKVVAERYDVAVQRLIISN
ncbi:5-formyltetrahydrofolate cyclo-ligase [Brochothrix thermosphacta]|uniref:5-formyltetrahydrofolate cyclo-ligase n=1 Tax=Brochothrix thermosphacta TaxID=2756 RepID=A0A1D2LGT9_BROTH|nr:5-formyltetrahydrofolate cyclo-ligase [Brochothrix thermosphacta]ATF25237.1 5-formyltetrahydrofolate cyclo-ligase [Brochothrix thermosphacta]ATH84620.1 5-formyltetrahydrofolate cyclo-ligase [Brochothrix thermosphacta]MPQ27669.1 5-formyltetrahydrofolate cyclo-ligase [Brochothrix thermosphacta]ODJ65829.1 5-formyltetrahydrofolate cyclo-ligase [Brochothrix thermosphacta]ODJ69193.1 5-formyltetrahydrofolate cyclo-ligase [Brochothrix thermosphacta]